MLRTPSIPQKWKSDLFIMGIALIFMVFIASLVAIQYYLKYAQTIEGFSFRLNFTYQLTVFGSFAFLVPRIFQIVAQFPFQKHKIGLSVLTHFSFSLLFGLIHLTVCNLLLFLLDLSPSIIFPKFVFKYLTNIFHFYFLSYWATVGIYYGLQYFKEKTPISNRVFPKTITFLEVTSAKGKKILTIQEIFYFEAYDHYVKVHTHDKFYLIRKSLKNLSKELSPSLFLRVHRSTIVNLKKIDAYQNSKSGTITLTLINGAIINVSQKFKKILKEKITIGFDQNRPPKL